jgi:hypothetical protein
MRYLKIRSSSDKIISFIIEMEPTSLQLKEFRCLAQKSNQLHSCKELTKLVETVFSNLDVKYHMT